MFCLDEFAIKKILGYSFILTCIFICFKKTYYIGADKVNVYEDNSGKDKIIFTLNKDDVVVAYKENKGYIYCEENKEEII